MNIGLDAVPLAGFDIFLLLIIFLSVLYGGLQGISSSLSGGFSLLVSAVYLTCIFIYPFKQFLLNQQANAWANTAAFPIMVVIFMFLLRALALLFGQLTMRTGTKLLDDVLGLGWGILRASALLKLIFWVLHYAGMQSLMVNSAILNWYQKVVHVPM